MAASKLAVVLGLLVTFALLASPSWSLPMNRLRKRSDSPALGIGLRILAQITSVKVTNLFGHFLENQNAGNLTGEEILCNILPMENILPDCWENDLELFCFQKQLERDLYDLSDDVGLEMSRVQWIRDQLSYVPDSEAKDYICLNHAPFGLGRRCSELL